MLVKHSTKFILWNYHIPSRWLHVHKTFPVNLLTLLANLESFVGNDNNYKTWSLSAFWSPQQFNNKIPPNYVEWHVKLSYPRSTHCLLDENLILRFKLTTSHEGCPQLCIFFNVLQADVYYYFWEFILCSCYRLFCIYMCVFLHSTKHIMC